MSYLVIVESPSKARTIGRYLGSNYTIEASMGHLRDLPKSQLGVDVQNNFEPKYISIRGKGALISKLKKDAKKADKVFLATDPDREGEAISWHLAQLLGLDENEPIRVTFNEITKAAVRNGIKNPRVIDKKLVDAQQARRVLDRIVGYKISPVLWRTVKKGLSAGRVQSVATRLVVDREEEINNFEPKEYWNIDADLLSPRHKKTFNAKYYAPDGEKKQETVRDKARADEILNALSGADYVVKSIKRGEKPKKPYAPFITSTLQQEASYKLGFQPRKTMSVAQELYEGVTVPGHGSVGLITYMRTDSLRISDEAREAAKKLIISRYGEQYYPSQPRIYKAKSGAQDAHEAIRPTYVDLTPEELKNSLTKDHYKLYKLIWERFVASQMANAVYSVTNADIEANGYIFKASGSSILFPGYTAVYVDTMDTDAQAAAKGKRHKTLPEINEGDVLKCETLHSEQLFTQPPPRYNEATLIKTLEENGIGRPSTYAPTVTTILARGYVVRDKKMLVPTQLGELTTKIMKENFDDIVDVSFTANMESKLDEVEEGARSWTSVLSEFYGGFDESLKEAEKKLGDLSLKIPDEVSDVTCELCGRKMVYKMGSHGRFLACPGFPQCRNTKSIVEKIGVKCPVCGGDIIKRRSKTNKIFYACENQDCNFMQWDEPTGEACPKCGGMILKKTRWGKKLYCMNEDCDYERSPDGASKSNRSGTGRK
ncbi:MAG: type I DNA topoisomerase [Clostridia bacterium]|nr:type I DNA topoisomerase [Clostridia bacterium]